MQQASPARWAMGKGLHDESRAESRHVSAVKLSPRVWGEFEEAACDDGDVARDPEALREAALHALRLDCSKRSDEDVVAIGDWMLQSDHELAPIFQSWRQPWYQTSNSCGDRQRKGPENMLSPSNSIKRDISAVIRGNPDAAACFRGVQLLKQAVGALIYKEGDAGDSLYAVIEGKVGMWKRSVADGGEKLPIEPRKLSAMNFGAGSVRIGSDDLWRFGVKLAILSPGEVFGEASVGLGFKRLETAVVAHSEVGEAKLLVFPGAVYRTHMQQLFAPFWTEIQKREAVLRSVPYHFAEWNRESIFTIAYWQLSQPLKDGRILYKDGDATESVYWLVEGAVTVSCEINVIDTGSSFNFGAFATSHASSTSAASSMASSKRPSRLTKLRGMLQAAFAFKKVRWGKEVRIQDDAEASEGSTVEATTMSMYPDADVRVVLDYMTAPDIFGDFEVIRQDAVRRTTVHSSSSKTQLYRLSKPLFKLLVLENSVAHSHGTPAALKTRCDFFSKWCEVRACREGMQSVPVPWLMHIKDKFIGAMKQELSVAHNRRATNGRRSSNSLASSLRRRSVERKKSDDSLPDYDGLLLSVEHPFPSSPSSPVPGNVLLSALKTPPPSLSPSIFSGPRMLVTATRQELVTAKRLTSTMKRTLFGSAWFQRIRSAVAERHTRLIVRGSSRHLNVDIDFEDSSDDIDWTEELRQMESAVQPRELHSPSGDLVRKHAAAKRGSSRRLVHGLGHASGEGSSKNVMLGFPKSLRGLGSFRSDDGSHPTPPRPVTHFLSHSHIISEEDSQAESKTTSSATVLTPERHPSMRNLNATALSFSAIRETRTFDGMESFLGEVDTNPGQQPLHPVDIARPSSLPKPCLRSPGRPRTREASRGRASSLEEPIGGSGVRISDPPVCTLTPSPIISPRMLSMRGASHVHFGESLVADSTNLKTGGVEHSTLADAGRFGILSNAFNTESATKTRPIARQTIGGVTTRNLGPLKPLQSTTKRPSTRGLPPTGHPTAASVGMTATNSIPTGSASAAVLPRSSTTKPSTPFKLPSRVGFTSPSRVSPSPVTISEALNFCNGRVSTPALRPMTSSKSHGIGDCDQLSELLVSTSLAKHGFGRK